MASKRELIKRGNKEFYVRRDEKTGRFVEWDEVGPSLSRDVRQRAKKPARPGQGDRGDQPRHNRRRR